MKTKVISFVLGSVSTIATLYIVANLLPTTSTNITTKTEDSRSTEPVNKDILSEPTLYLPLSYFRRENLQGGSVNPDRDTSDFTTWERANFDGGYRSFPTTTITFTDFSSESASLPPLPEDDWQQELPDSVLSQYLVEQAQESNLGARMANDGYRITEQMAADVNLDGIEETIISVESGGNHPPLGYYVIQDEEIIFSGGFGTLLLSGIEPSPDGNGFTLNWVDDKHLEGRGLCCASGYTSTRFVSENGQFIPVYEQDNRFFKVKNLE